MANSYEQIIKDINEHLQKSGRSYYSDFYIGISSDARNRLFKEHHVKENSWWIYRVADSSGVAREVEQYYLKLGMRGNTSGGDASANMFIVMQSLQQLQNNNG